MIALVLLVWIGRVVGDSNRGSALTVCNPAWYPEGSGYYCTDYQGGWFNGGNPTNSEQFGDPVCEKNGNPCQCPDCGWDIINNDQCQQWRCNDDSGYYDANGNCYELDSNGNRINTGGQWNFGCYKKAAKCDYCQPGYQAAGCGRYSAGQCQPCPNYNRFVLTVNYFQPGTCNLLPCSAVAKGQFISSQCTISSDVNTTGCYYYEPEVGPGNPGSPRSQLLGDTQNRSYCPGNGAVVTLPANSRPSDDYSGFVCLDGYFQTGASCQACAAGSACLYGQSYQCPLRYYSQGTSNAYCTLCTTSCPGNSYFPVMCPVGGTQDTSCIACGMCSINPQYGLTCDETPHETAKLPWKCVPLKSSGAVAVCDPTVSPRAPA